MAKETDGYEISVGLTLRVADEKALFDFFRRKAEEIGEPAHEPIPPYLAVAMVLAYAETTLNECGLKTLRTRIKGKK